MSSEYEPSRRGGLRFRSLLRVLGVTLVLLCAPLTGVAAEPDAVVATAAASAAEGSHGDFVTLHAGGAQIWHIYNGLSVPATDLAIEWQHYGKYNGLILQLEWLHVMPTDTDAPLIGGRVGWGFRLPNLPVEPYANISLGIYAADVAPVLPIGYVGIGVRKTLANHLTFVVAIDGMVSLFAVGVNPRLGVGYAF